MSRRTPSLLAGLGLAVLIGGSLAACASEPAGSGPTDEPAPPAGDSAEIELDAAWLDGGRLIGLVTQGSSTCVPIAEEATVAVDGSLAVTFVDPDPATPCTADLAPRVTLVAVPEGVDPAQGVEIVVTGDGYHGDTDLDGAEGLAAGGETDFLPSAGWTGDDGQFVILTWGSSSCPPVIEDVAATGAAEVTVTFAEPEEDQVCTMDMAPRAIVAAVTGLEADSGVELVLTGAPEFDDVRIPILGDDD